MVRGAELAWEQLMRCGWIEFVGGQWLNRIYSAVQADTAMVKAAIGGLEGRGPGSSKWRTTMVTAVKSQWRQ